VPHRNRKINISDISEIYAVLLKNC